MICSTSSDTCFSTLHDATFRRFSTSRVNLRHTRVSFPTRNTRGSIIRIRAKAVNDGSTVNSVSMCPLERMSFYELLGISEKCSLGEIKQAYKQLARRYHPDVSPPDRVQEYTNRFIRVHEAYETLSDPGTRAMYDCDMARGRHLSFSTGKRDPYSDRKDGMMEWRHRWQTQLQELKIRRSARKEEDEDADYQNMTWGARMRRKRNQAAAASS